MVWIYVRMCCGVLRRPTFEQVLEELGRMRSRLCSSRESMASMWGQGHAPALGPALSPAGKAQQQHQGPRFGEVLHLPVTTAADSGTRCSAVTECHEGGVTASSDCIVADSGLLQKHQAQLGVDLGHGCVRRSTLALEGLRKRLADQCILQVEGSSTHGHAHAAHMLHTPVLGARAVECVVIDSLEPGNSFSVNNPHWLVQGAGLAGAVPAEWYRYAVGAAGAVAGAGAAKAGQVGASPGPQPRPPADATPAGLVGVGGNSCEPYLPHLPPILYGERGEEEEVAEMAKDAE